MQCGLCGSLLDEHVDACSAQVCRAHRHHVRSSTPTTATATATIAIAEPWKALKEDEQKLAGEEGGSGMQVMQ